MGLATAIFLFALYKGTETFWEKGFEAAWDPVDNALKKRFARWAGTDQETQRRAAFTKAAAIARSNTLRTAPDPQQAEYILDALDSGRDQRNAEALAEEAAKLMLFAASPDVPRLTEICHRTLRFDALFAEQSPPPPETVAVILSDFLTNLREALLDQEPYHDLIQKDMRRALNEILVELRPVPYDDEAIYRSQVAEMYRELEFVGIPEIKERRPITVEDVFIRLRSEREVERAEMPLVESRQDLFEKSGLRDIDSSQAMPDRVGRADRVIKEQVDVDEALRQARRLVILGDPGAGKSTLLKYLTVICAEGRAGTELSLEANGDKPLLPIFIPLREFAAECDTRNQDYGLLDYLYTHAREHLLLHLPRGFFEQALEAGRCLVCLDGLDEVWAIGQRKTVTGAVKAFVSRFPHSRYIIASRIVGYDEAPLDRRDFVHHTILPLKDEDIQAFIDKWYQIRERDPVRRRRKIADLVATIEREPRIQTLARNPLLLTIIALVHRIEAELPHERVKLYDKCVTTLVDTWEEVKGLTLAEKQHPFYRYRRRLLERLAFELHTRTEKPRTAATVREGDLERLLTDFLMENRRLGFAEDPDGAREEARALIRLARGRTGLLVERGDKVFAFPHLTFQEYLTACEIEQRCFGRGADAVWDVIQHRLHDAHWREVILLLLGSLNKYEYDDPTTNLLERILQAGEQDQFEPLLHRHLYLAIRALADRVDVTADLHQRIVDKTLRIARQAPEWEREDAFNALSWLEQDDYAADGLRVLAQDGQVDDKVRRAAAQALGQLGRVEEAAEVLLALAQGGQVEDSVRCDAAQALRELGHAEEAVETLLALAQDGQVDNLVRYIAVQALEELGNVKEQVLNRLLALARDGQISLVRCAAAQALRELSHAEEWVLDGLLDLIQDGQANDQVRRDAVRALGKLGCAEEKISNGLLALARDRQVEDGVHCTAAQALEELGHTEEAVEILLTLARDGHVESGVRSTAAQALGELGHAEEAAEILLTLVRDSQVKNSVRQDAAQALRGLGHAEVAMEILLGLAQDDQVDDSVRRAAAQALGELGRAEENILDSLLALAQDDQVDDWVRCAAAKALGELGWAKEAVEILLPLARGDRVSTWVYHTEEAVEALLALAQDNQVDDWVRNIVVQALGKLGRAEGRVFQSLLALAQDNRVSILVRSAAAQALGDLGRAEGRVVDGLLALAQNDHVKDSVRHAAAHALGDLGRTEEAVGVLLNLARDSRVNISVRSAAAQALGGLGRIEDAVGVLLILARDGKTDHLMRRATIQALVDLGRAEEAAQALLTFARDSYNSVRYEAYNGLKELVEGTLE
ncbi:MAG TPA: tetratricopeptide repeat protein [Chloroflexi bacterium]|nr:tetratricopeptide repeat protein [Chloroflexota bacterium]